MKGKEKEITTDEHFLNPPPPYLPAPKILWTYASLSMFFFLCPLMYKVTEWYWLSLQLMAVEH